MPDNPIVCPVCKREVTKQHQYTFFSDGFIKDYVHNGDCLNHYVKNNIREYNEEYTDEYF